MKNKERKQDKKQTISCDVSSCLHNDTECNKCELDEIKVSCQCNSTEAEKKETICDSFDCDCGCQEQDTNDEEEDD